MRVVESTNTVGISRATLKMTLPRMMAVLVFLVVLAFNVQAVRDPDLWWHLAVGEYMLETGSIPTADPDFAFTTEGQFWFMHEWLSEIVMILVYNAAGLEGLSVFFGVVVALTYLLVYLVSPGRPYLAALVTVVVSFGGLLHTSARPHMFNLLLGGLIVFLVESIKDKRFSVHWLWVIPPMMAIWVNLHSGFLFGFAILGVYVVGETAALWLGNDRRALGWPKLGVVVVVTVAAAGASLLNNNGFHVWLYPFETLSSDAMRQLIAEWHSPDFHSWYAMYFGLTFVGTLVLMAFNPKRPTLTDVLFVVGTGVASLQSVRHITLFLILAIPIICRQIMAIIDDTPFERWFSGNGKSAVPLTSLQNGMNWTIVLLAIVAVNYIIFVTSLTQTEEVVAFHYPKAAVDYMEAEGLTDGRVYNAYGWGGYLIWRGIQPFIDGRADLYGDEFLFLFLQIDDLELGWQEVLDEYQIDYILVREGSYMARFLVLEDDTWQLLYEDDVAVVFARKPSAS